MRRQLPQATWKEIQTAYSSGIPLRQIARNMGIPAGTILSRAKREAWTQQSAIVKITESPKLARDLMTPSAGVTPSQAASMCLKERGELYRERIARVGESILPHLEKLSPQALLDESDKIDRMDKVTRRAFGLDRGEGNAPMINLNLLALGAEALIQKG